MSEQIKRTTFTEAPASWNTRYLTPDGFVCQLTLRGERGEELIEHTENALALLKEKGFMPPYPNNGVKPKGNNNEKHHEQSVDSEDPAWCPIHQCTMRRWEKNGRAWYSHKIDGEWCKGK